MNNNIPLIVHKIIVTTNVNMSKLNLFRLVSDAQNLLDVKFLIKFGGYAWPSFYTFTYLNVSIQLSLKYSNIFFLI